MSDKTVTQLLLEHFPGRVVRKDLTKLIKEGANVPVYVLEYLLGMYCASDDEAIIEEGMKSVKKILAENYVRPDEAEKVKSKVRELGSYKIIDKVGVKLNTKRDVYEATMWNLGVGNIEIEPHYVKDYEKLLEDLDDLSVIAERREETTIPHAEFKKGPKRNGFSNH